MDERHVVLGLLVCVLAGGAVARRPAPTTERARPAAAQEVEVPVTRHELLPGHTITREDLTSTKMLAIYLAPGVKRRAEALIGCVVRERILPHEPVRTARLSRWTSSGPIPLAPRNTVAETVRSTLPLPPGLFAGNWVDVLVTTLDQEGRPTNTRTLLQAVLVLGVVEPAASQQVVLALPETTAKRVVQASQEDAVALALRRDIDVTHVTTHGRFLDPTQRLPMKPGPQIGRWEGPHVRTLSCGKE